MILWEHQHSAQFSEAWYLSILLSNFAVFNCSLTQEHFWWVQSHGDLCCLWLEITSLQTWLGLIVYVHSICQVWISRISHHIHPLHGTSKFFCSTNRDICWLLPTQGIVWNAEAVFKYFVNDSFIKTVLDGVPEAIVPVEVLKVKFLIQVAASSNGLESQNAHVAGLYSGWCDGSKCFWSCEQS